MTKNTKNIKQGKTPKKTKHELFSYQARFSVFIGGGPKFPFLTTWPKKRAPRKL